MTSINSILNEISGGTKTAAETNDAPAPSVADARNALSSALASHQKVASTEETPLDIEKLASHIGDIDFAGTVREGELVGAAIFDGFIKRANEYAASSAKLAADDSCEEDDKKSERKEKEDAEDMEKEASDYMVAGGKDALEKVAAL